jgi:hypothetical protein
MNENQIKALRWEKDQVIGLGNSLSLRLRKSSKTYFVRKMISEKPQVITLGKSPDLSLMQAKLEAGGQSDFSSNSPHVNEVTIIIR